jgi:hypothetical protein
MACDFDPALKMMLQPFSLKIPPTDVNTENQFYEPK